MKPLTAEWVSKAEGDWVTAQREVRSRIDPNYDAACFHAQQCAEKYLKAFLQEADVPFEKTHNLYHLLDLCLPAQPMWEGMRIALGQLSIFAVTFRYPGENADKTIARTAVSLCRMVRAEVRSALSTEPV
jgi:HEPN domain-containing protein